MMNANLSIDGILATSKGSEALDKDEALATFGTLARYAAQVSIWRMARLARYAVSQVTPEAESWTLGDCTCQMATLRNAKGAPMFGEMCEAGPDGDDTFAPVARVHGFCGGNGGAPNLSISGRVKGRVEEACEGCTCQGHLLDSRDNAIQALREALAEGARQDAAWEALTPAERTALTLAEGASKARPQMHLAGNVAEGGPEALARALGILPEAPQAEAPATLAESIGLALAPCARGEAPHLFIQDGDGVTCQDCHEAGHTCGPRQAGESWMAYGLRRKGCQGCQAEAESWTLAPVALSVPEMGAGVIRGDRVASKGRNATLGAGQGGQRIGRASPLAC